MAIARLTNVTLLHEKVIKVDLILLEKIDTVRKCAKCRSIIHILMFESIVRLSKDNKAVIISSGAVKRKTQ